MSVGPTAGFAASLGQPVQSVCPKEKEEMVTSSAGLHSTKPFLTFTDVSITDVQKLEKMSATARREYLANTCMKIDQDEGTFLYDIAADYFLHSYNFCTRTNSFSAIKISTFLSLMRTLFVESFAVGMTQSESYELFKYLLLKHSCQRPPFSTGVFDKADVSIISDYTMDTFFRHYKMYKYCYTCVRELEVKIRPPAAIENDFPKFRCKASNEVDPRKEPLLDSMFEEERKAEVLKKQYEAAEKAKREAMSFTQRVEYKLGELEETVMNKIKELEPAEAG